jgi:hypothetical protein
MISTSTQKPRPLAAGHFRRIAERGFGGGYNSYAYSYAWYDDHLYIGTNRNALQTIIMRWPFKVPFEFPPVPVPDRYEELDLRGQIWRYSPATDTWERVFRSPMVRGFEGRLAPVAVAFRCMVVFQGKSDERPALYTLPVVGRNAPGCSTLRSLDGIHFEKLNPPQLEGEQQNFGSFRAVAPFKGKLWVAPTQTKGDPKVLRTYANVIENVDVRCSDDPVRGRWEISCAPGFGDPTNRGIIEMQAWGDYLYVGTLNVREGFQLWRTDGEGPAPHRWERVLDRGADRGPLNQAVLSMAVFNDCLYIGTAIQNGGHDKTNNIGPAAAEVIRVYPDGTWDLVCGYPRLTRQGLKIPTSGMGPGFDNPLAGYLWRLCAHDGALYAGTYDLSTYVPFLDRSHWPDHVRRIFDPATLERFLKLRGGAELWRSTDGDNWVPVTRNGFNNHYNFGIRAIQSTPVGLFVGTANPFGPKVAVKTPFGWRYEENPRGGIEIWHGAVEHAPYLDAAGRLVYPPRRSRAVSTVGDLPPMAMGTPPEMGYDAESPESRAAMFLADEQARYSVSEVEQAIRDTCDPSPIVDLASAEKDLVGLDDSLEDEISQYFQGGMVRNAGYWESEADTPRQAALALVKHLLLMFPRDGDRPRSFLIVAAGASAIASQLLEQDREAAVTIMSEGTFQGKRRWIGRAKNRRGRRDLADVADASADVLLWIEGPSKRSRQAALREAHRVLRAGGTLLAADLAGTPIDALPRAATPPGPSAVEACERELTEAGFVEARVVDISRHGWQQFYQNSRQFFLTKLLFQQIDTTRHKEVLRALPGGDVAVDAHLLIAAHKPPEKST